MGTKPRTKAIERPGKVVTEREERCYAFVSELIASHVNETIATPSDAMAQPINQACPLPIAAATNREAARQGSPKPSSQRLSSLDAATVLVLIALTGI